MKKLVSGLVLILCAFAAGAQVQPHPASGNQISSVSGNGHTIATTNGGPVTNGDSIVGDANGNLVDSGSAPAGSGGSPSTTAQAALPAGSQGFACDETSTAGVPAATVDYVRCDSVTHSLLGSANGSAEAPLLLSNGAQTQYTLPFAAAPTSGTSALTAANVVNLGTVFTVPPQGLTISHVAVSLSVADSTQAHLYDLCVWKITGTTGTLVAHTGALAGGSGPMGILFGQSLSLSGAPLTLAAGTYVYGWTGTANTVAMYAPWSGTNSTVVSPYGEGNSNTTSGGVCGNITLSAISYQTTVQPPVWLLF